MAYALSIFLSALLLFQVELIFGKFFLPWFGGAAAVWTTCLMYFQVMLLAGYLYAHVLAVRANRRNQGRIHASLLLLSLVLLAVGAWRTHQPLLPPDSWRPAAGTGSPVLALVLLLTGTLGLPFVLLSATSPLLQRWYSEERPQSPYRLYALSNLGSMLALCSYPLLVEPFLPLGRQADLWAVCYGVCAVAVGWLAVGGRARGAAAGPVAEPARPAAAAPGEDGGGVALWLLLPACSTALLLAVTNELCQNVAAVPLLWMVPLALYLLSFIITFEGPRGYPRRAVLLAAVVAALATLVVNFYGFLFTILPQILFMNLALFALCMACHGELVRLKPAPGRLTLFYLMIAAGGACGGIAVAVAAPLLFPDFWEFHGAIILCMAGLLLALRRDRRSIVFTGDPWHAYVLVAFTVLAVWSQVLPAPLAAGASPRGWVAAGAAVLLVATLVRGLSRTRSVRSPWWPRLSLGVVLCLAGLFLGLRLQGGGRQCVAAARNFYGVLRVQDRVQATGLRSRMLTHGRVVHGAQLLTEPWTRTPVAYYAPGSGVGLALRVAAALNATNAAGAAGLRIGVTGLGTGVLAAYARPGDRVRFYELNPTVTTYAELYFSYLRDAPGRMEMAPAGDARLAMEHEYAQSGSQQFDVLVLDAFSGDSIPTHLLTVEAFRLYEKHLRGTQSLMAAHISNRYLDLRPLLFSLAEELGWSALWIPYRGEPPYPSTSSWVLFTRDPAFREHPAIRERVVAYQPPRRILWTDKASDVISLLAVRPDGG